MNMVEGESSDDNTSDSLLPQDLSQESQDLEIACKMPSYMFPHIFTYNQSQQDGNDNNDSFQNYFNPQLNEFMKMSLEITGKDIKQEIAHHRHKIRDFKNISIHHLMVL